MRVHGTTVQANVDQRQQRRDVANARRRERRKMLKDVRACASVFFFFSHSTSLKHRRRRVLYGRSHDGALRLHAPAKVYIVLFAFPGLTIKGGRRETGRQSRQARAFQEVPTNVFPWRTRRLNLFVPLGYDVLQRLARPFSFFSFPLSDRNGSGLHDAAARLSRRHDRETIFLFFFYCCSSISREEQEIHSKAKVVKLLKRRPIVSDSNVTDGGVTNVSFDDKNIDVKRVQSYSQMLKMILNAEDCQNSFSKLAVCFVGSITTFSKESVKKCSNFDDMLLLI